MMEERWTILRVLEWTTDYFRRKAIEQPRSNAEVLLAHVLGRDRLQLYLTYDQPLAPGELAQYREAIRRRAAREPTQYITGRKEFWSMELEVTPSVLIPRPETELLVEKALELLKGSTKHVLDLGTGSGAIAIALARECPLLRIVATDRSREALQVARRNALRHQLAHRISFVAGDLFSCFSPSRPTFDVIVSNPPYLSDSDYDQLAPEVRDHEPKGALWGGEDGLAAIRLILAGAFSHLGEGGSLLLEIGAGQSERIQNMPELDFTDKMVELYRDYSGVERILHIRRKDR